MLRSATSIRSVRMIENRSLSARVAALHSWFDGSNMLGQELLSIQRAARSIPFSAHELSSCQKYNRHLK